MKPITASLIATVISLIAIITSLVVVQVNSNVERVVVQPSTNQAIPEGNLRVESHPYTTSESLQPAVNPESL